MTAANTHGAAAGSVAVASVTDVGPTRQRNEDAVVLPGLILAAAPHGQWVGLLDSGSVALVQVIDGMGGHGAGSWASAVSAVSMNESASQARQGPEPDEAWLATAIQVAADTVTQVGALTPDTRIMGAATAGLVVGCQSVVVFNVGDCRVYVLEDGYLSLLTVDHRSRAGGGLTRSLGGTGVKEQVAADMLTMDRAVDRRYLVCSDGLTDTLDFDTIRDLVSGDSADITAHALVDAAVAAGSHDNVTVVVLDVARS